MAAGMYLEHYLDSKTIVFVSTFIPINKHISCSQCPACLHVSYSCYIYYLQKRARNDTKQRYLDRNVYGYLVEANGLTVLNSVMMWILVLYICLVGAVPINVTTLLLLKRLNDVNDVKYLGTLKLSVKH